MAYGSFVTLLPSGAARVIGIRTAGLEVLSVLRAAMAVSGTPTIFAALLRAVRLHDEGRDIA